MSNYIEIMSKEFTTCSKIGYFLVDIKDFYVPLINCDVELILNDELTNDNLSRLLLNIIKLFKTHKEVCNFLGVLEDDFVTCQIDYLVQEGYVLIDYINGNKSYEVTDKGNSFIYDRFVTETRLNRRLQFTICGLTNRYYSYIEDQFLENDYPENNGFSKYHVIHNVVKSRFKEIIKLGLCTDVSVEYLNNTEFYKFVDREMMHGNFFDFASDSVNPKYSYIQFSILKYKNDNNELFIEIRHNPKTSVDFTGNAYFLEDKYTNFLNNKIKNNPDYLQKIENNLVINKS